MIVVDNDSRDDSTVTTERIASAVSLPVFSAKTATGVRVPPPLGFLASDCDVVMLQDVGRIYEEGKKITWEDSVRTISCILRFNLVR